MHCDRFTSVLAVYREQKCQLAAAVWQTFKSYTHMTRLRYSCPEVGGRAKSTSSSSSSTANTFCINSLSSLSWSITDTTCSSNSSTPATTQAQAVQHGLNYYVCNHFNNTRTKIMHVWSYTLNTQMSRQSARVGSRSRQCNESADSVPASIHLKK